MSQPNFEFDYDKFLRESSQTYNEALWQAIRERYGAQAYPNFQYRADKSTQDSAYFERVPTDTSARLPYDIEGECNDINDPGWQSGYRWYQDNQRMTIAYQYRPFDKWFTLFECTREYLYEVARRRNPGITSNISRQIKDLIDEKRYYKVERLY